MNCPTCGEVEHQAIPEDESHCGCEEMDLGPIGCVCPCHFGLLDHQQRKSAEIEILSKSKHVYWAFCPDCFWNSRQADSPTDPTLLDAIDAHMAGRAHR